MTNEITNENETPQKGLPYKWKTLWSVVFGLFMVILDQTVVNVAFPTFREEFNTTLSHTQWVLSIYVMAMGISTPISGFLGDKFGMKRVYIAGLILFVIGSFLCGVAPNLDLLIVARALQGIGGGLALPIGSALLFRAFPPEEQGFALGMFGITLTVAPALGPILGGWLVTENLWRWIFYINVPIGLAGIWVASRWLKESKIENAPPLSIPSLIFSTIGFGAVLYGASIAADEGWTSMLVLTSFVVGGIGLIVFAVLELFIVKHPLLDLRLFKNPTFLIATMVGYVATVALFGAEFLMPVYLQALRGYSALDAGIYLLPLALTAAITTGVAGRLYDKIGPRVLIIVGYALLIFNTYELSLLEADTNLNTILWLLAVRGVAIGCTVQATFTAALSVVPFEKASRGSALINASRNTIQAIAVALLATILTSALSPKVKNLQDAFQDAPTAQQNGQTQQKGQTQGICTPDAAPSIDDPLASPFDGGMGKRMKELRAQACQENLKGLDNAYIFTFYFAIFAFFLGFFLPGWPGKWEGRAAMRQEAIGH